MKFTLEVNLGNEAMETADHLAAMLRKVAKEVDKSPADGPEVHPIRDVNGNTVGKWEVAA